MSGPAWLTDEEQRMWRKLVAMTTLLPAALDARLQREAGLTHFSYWVLAMLSEARDRSLRMSELAARCNSSLSRLSHVVGKLEARGWVRRQRPADDARGNLAVLTDEGFAKVVATAPGHVEQVRALVFDRLTLEQVHQIDEICAALLTELDPGGRVAALPD
ncbi:MAG TPA: MarR family transcriptional regulator [Acidimicrobiales bacterium]|nr:MarR family transcriptional regulator [Acidimicrobiales bacterium]